MGTGAEVSDIWVLGPLCLGPLAPTELAKSPRLPGGKRGGDPHGRQPEFEPHAPQIWEFLLKAPKPVITCGTMIYADYSYIT